MNKQTAFTISIIFILCSCIDKPQVQTKLIDDFPEPTELKGEEVFETHFKKATVQHFDSLIILTADMDNLFHVFNKEDKLITSFGREGRGPGEFIRTPFISDIYRQDTASYGFVYDEIMGKLVNINFTASISEGEVVVQNRPELPPKLHKSSLMEIFYIRENSILV